MSLLREVKLVSRGRDWRGRSRTPRSAEQWAPVRERREFPTSWARTKPARAVREGVQRGVLRPLVWSQTSPQVYGSDRLSGVDGPVIVIANHASHLDAPLILNALPARLSRRTAVGAAADYFFDARWRASLTALVFNAFPIERSGGGRRQKMLAPKLIEEGWSILLFPEGTRSQDGWMRAFRRGAAQLALQHDIPVVPMAIRGAYGAMPRGRNWPRPGRPRIAVHIGRPITPVPDETVPAFSNRLSAAVTQLWAEEDLGWWGAMRAAEQETLPATTGPKAASWRRTWESTRPLPDKTAKNPVWRR
jgi:1-acyl-sn-glycerol-3-phosphate acyltransferase